MRPSQLPCEERIRPVIEFAPPDQGTVWIQGIRDIEDVERCFVADTNAVPVEA
jgi:hypothetical protein